MKKIFVLLSFLTSMNSYSQPITILGSPEDHKIVRLNFDDYYQRYFLLANCITDNTCTFTALDVNFNILWSKKISLPGNQLRATDFMQHIALDVMVSVEIVTNIPPAGSKVHVISFDGWNGNINWQQTVCDSIVKGTVEDMSFFMSTSTCGYSYAGREYQSNGDHHLVQIEVDTSALTNYNEIWSNDYLLKGLQRHHFQNTLKTVSTYYGWDTTTQEKRIFFTHNDIFGQMYAQHSLNFGKNFYPFDAFCTTNMPWSYEGFVTGVYDNDTTASLVYVQCDTNGNIIFQNKYSFPFQVDSIVLRGDSYSYYSSSTAVTLGGMLVLGNGHRRAFITSIEIPTGNVMSSIIITDSSFKYNASSFTHHFYQDVHGSAEHNNTTNSGTDPALYWYSTLLSDTVCMFAPVNMIVSNLSSASSTDSLFYTGKTEIPPAFTCLITPYTFTPYIYCADSMNTIQENTTDILLQVFPNPASNNININLNETQLNGRTAEVYLYDSFGRLAEQRNVTSFPQVLTTQLLPNGMYVVHVKSGGRLFTEKVIIDK